MDYWDGLLGSVAVGFPTGLLNVSDTGRRVLCDTRHMQVKEVPKKAQDTRLSN